MSALAQPGTTVPIGSHLSSSGAQGITGLPGETGATGQRGPQGDPSTTKLTAPFSVPQAGQSIQATVEDASWVIAGQILHIEKAGETQAGLFQVTEVNGNLVTLQSPEPPTGLLLPKPFCNISGDRALTPQESGYYFLCSGGEMTLELPQPELALSYSIRNDMTSAPSGPVHLKASPGSMIENKDLLDLWPEGECQLFTDGAHWRIFSGGGDSIPLGSLIPYAGTHAPIGFLLCDGQWYEIEKYPRLFAVIEYDYTLETDGEHAGWFQVPDLRSRVPVGTGPLDTQPSHNFTLAQKYGTPSHALTSAELAVHNHGNVDINHHHAVGLYNHGHGLSDPGHQTYFYSGGNWERTWPPEGTTARMAAGGWWSGANVGIGCWLSAAGNPGGWTNWVSDQAANWHVRETSNSGSAIPHNNIPPSLGMTYLIKS